MTPIEHFDAQVGKLKKMLEENNAFAAATDLKRANNQFCDLELLDTIGGIMHDCKKNGLHDVAELARTTAKELLELMEK